MHMRKTKYIFIALILVFSLLQLGASPLSAFKKLNQVISLAQELYFEDFDINEAMEGAIRGFLEELDPHSQYISKKEYESISEQFEGEFEGIGIEFSMIDGFITVISPIPETPSERAGLQPGDKIVKINDESAYKLSNDEIFKIIEEFSENSVSFYDFIEDINKEFSYEDKLSLISFLWEMAYADSILEVNEERLIRRIADLIKVKDIHVLKIKDKNKST